MKKILFAFLAFFACIGINQKALAAGGVSVISITGESHIVSGPNLTDGKYVWQTQGLSNMTYKQYGDSDFTKSLASGSNTGSSTGFALGCNAYWVVSGNGGEFNMKVHVTGLSDCEGYPSKSDDKTEPPSTGGSDSGGSGTACDTCGAFQCPEWDKYMGQLSDIKNAIPPAPNWSQVADTFQKQITPQIKEDMADLIGTAKTPTLPKLPEANKPAKDPAQPKAPIKSIFEVLDGVDERNKPKPTMDDTPDAGFNENDVKNVEPPKENKDESGGFKIDNPLDSLPDGDEFAKPKQETITAPTPKEDNLQAPVPKEDNLQPPRPKEDNLKPPVPSDDNIKTPIPKDDVISPPNTGGHVNIPIPNK